MNRDGHPGAIVHPKRFEGVAEGDIVGVVKDEALLDVEIRVNPDFAEKGGRHGFVGKPNAKIVVVRATGSVGNALEALMDAHEIGLPDLDFNLLGG